MMRERCETQTKGDLSEKNRWMASAQDETCIWDGHRLPMQAIGEAIDPS